MRTLCDAQSATESSHVEVLPSIAGMLVGAASVLIAQRLFLQGAERSRRGYAFAAAFVVAFAVGASLLYQQVGTRHLAGARANAQVSAAAMPPGAPGSSSAAAQSMDVEVAKLASRLAREGGTDGDWNLLAQAYDMLGRPDDARRARSRIASDPGAGQMSSAMLVDMATQLSDGKGVAVQPQAAAAATPARELQATPRDAAGWLMRADSLRAQRDFPGARAAYEQVISLKAMTAQSWADYADTVASVSGGALTGEAGQAIDNALALDPSNAKALWLKASQAHEQRKYAEALVWWGKLRAVMAPDSPDVRIIDGNIAEDKRLASTAAPAPAGVPAGAAELSGTVTIDSSVAARVQPDATLFIYAKAADAPGPPLAVYRTNAATWPVSFKLDDSMAMMPSRRLSQFDRVIVEARISRTGNAAPSSGDLYATSAVLSPTAGKKVALVINRQIG
jgi:cytochrome c-type biogenesis protein CcmH